jgi:8-oxo-dGTP pyrophosphatase MutT (NUDIX family)
MEKSIICSGALFYSINTKRFLFLQRTDKKTKGLWGLVGGKNKFRESVFEGLKREVTEEIGSLPAFKKVIPLELFTSNDEKFFFNTYVIAIQDEFLPKLNHEHSSYAWCAFECWPKNLHMGLRNTLNNKSIKGKLQTILDLIV